MIEGFQVSDGQGVAMPANWPENELIGKTVIVPPADTVKQAKIKAERYDNYDWWLCYKDAG